MNRVLIIGPNYYNFLPAVDAAFRELGWETAVAGYDTPVHPYTFGKRLRYKLSLHRERLVRQCRSAWQGVIQQRFEEVRPDLVFVMNGDLLEAETLDRFRRSAKVALWLFDSRAKLPGAAGHENHVDALFCFEQADVEAFRSEGKQACFLPQACDTATYHPIPGIRKDIDILFVGNMYYSPRRKALMNAVAARFPGQKVLAYGWYQPWFKGIGAWLRRPYKKVFTNVNVSSENANLLYNRARIALNIHQEHQRNGANPRVFEICGSGAYQICDRNPYVESLFPDGSVGLYSGEEELIARIEAALSSDMSGQAAAACRYVREQHTFRNRMETVLKTVFGVVPPVSG